MEQEPDRDDAAEPEPKVRLVAVHSFRGGTGKSNLAANLAFLAAREGARVAVLDTDLQSPGVHALFQLEPQKILRSLTDFVQGKCEIKEVAIDLTAELDLESGGGKLFFLPSSLRLEAITSILSKGYETARLNQHMLQLARDLDLDYLILDTHPGLNRETMLSLSICDTVAIIVRPDRQDFQGTAVLVQIAKKIGVPKLLFIANKVASGLDPAEVSKKVEDAFGYPVAGVLPLCEELLRLGSRGLFVTSQPRHPFTKELERIGEQLLPVRVRAGDES